MKLSSALGGRPDALIVFDSEASGTPDPDLEVDVGHLAIIPEDLIDVSPADGLVDAPNDSAEGGTQIYTFDFSRTVRTVVIVDAEDDGTVDAYNAAGGLVKSVPVPAAADGSVQTIAVNAGGVRRLEISVPGSFGATRVDLGF